VLWVTYGLALAAYNLVVLVRLPSWYNIGALSNTLLGFAGVFIFLRQDISAPFLSVARRGWRRSPRMDMALRATLDGVEHTTVNISSSGMLVRCDGCAHALNESVTVGLPLGADRVELTATVVRTDGATTAVGFPADRRRLLHGLLRCLAETPGGDPIEPGSVTTDSP
jgi:uncharacterized membrane protein